MDHPTIYLVPTSNDQAYKHLTETVIQGIPRAEFPEPSITDEDRVHVWGTKEKVGHQQSFERGDILLFYTGDRTYTQAAVVRETTFNEEIARSLWGIDDTSATSDTEPWSHLLYLDPPVEVEIDGGTIADFADYGMDYILGLQTLNQQGHDGIIEQFGSIANFIVEHATQLSPTEVYDRTPLLEEFTQQSDSADSEGSGQSGVSESTDDEGTTGPTSGLAGSGKWQSRCREFGAILERTNQVALAGPPTVVSVAQVYRLCEQWLANQDGAAEQRIFTVSIDSGTTYQDFVERTLVSRESIDSVVTTDGPFKRACRLAHAAQNEAEYENEDVPEFVLLVESRENAFVGDVLGQLSHVLEPSIRSREPKLQLPHSGETIRIPANLNIVTIHRSSGGSIPTSLRQNFRIVPVSSDLDLVSEVYGYDAVEAAKTDVDSNEASIAALSIAALETLTREAAWTVESELGPELFIDYSGESSDSPSGQYDDETLLDVWQYNVLPTLNSEWSEYETILEKTTPSQGSESQSPVGVTRLNRDQLREFLGAIRTN